MAHILPARGSTGLILVLHSSCMKFHTSTSRRGHRRPKRVMRWKRFFFLLAQLAELAEREGVGTLSPGGRTTSSKAAAGGLRLFIANARTRWPALALPSSKSAPTRSTPRRRRRRDPDQHRLGHDPTPPPVRVVRAIDHEVDGRARHVRDAAPILPRASSRDTMVLPALWTKALRDKRWFSRWMPAPGLDELLHRPMVDSACRSRSSRVGD